MGFLFTEGLIAAGRRRAASPTATTSTTQEQRYNVVTVTLHRPFDACRSASQLLRDVLVRDLRQGRAGRRRGALCARGAGARRSRPTTLVALPDALRAKQRVFDRTGGLHAAGLFDAAGVALVSLREDVGRHNAVDKVIGEQVLAGGVPLARPRSCR